MPRALDRPVTRAQGKARGGPRRQSSSGADVASPLSVPFKVAARPAHSLHDAALSLVDGAIDTLRRRHDDQAIHAARKACKRIRAALRLLRGCLGPGVYRRENRRVRDASKPLTAVRDAFILRKTLGALPHRPVAFQRGLDSDYRAERQVLERRGARRALNLLTETRARLLDLPSVGSEAASAIAGARSVYKAGRKALRNARHRDDEALHEWRKQTQYLVNQLELLKSVFNAKFGKLHQSAEKIADALGDDHDLGVLMSKLQAYEAPDESFMKVINKRRGKLQARAFRMGRKLYRHPEKHFEAIVAARLARPK